MSVRRIAALAFALLVPLSAAAENRVVASAHPLASAAGKSILDAGGNAVDAAVAVQMTLSVVEPHASGIGGGAFLLLWDPATRRVRAFDGVAAQPARATESLTVDADGSHLPIDRVRFSGRSVGVPGAVAMLADLHGREGRLPWADLFQPAIRAAEEGFPLPAYLHHALTVQGRRVADPALRAEWLEEDGQPKPVGARVRNAAQAETLRRLAAEGPDALYRGDLARAIVAAVAADAVPGFLAEADLGAYRPREREPLCRAALGHRLCTMPPPSYGGIVALQILAMTGGLGIAGLAPDGAAAAHLFLEASRLAYADRFLHVGDPDFEAVPTAGLVDGGYLAARARLIRAEASMGRAAAGDPPGRRADIAPSEPWSEAATSHLAIVDGDGRIVSMTTTINLYFGSGIAVGGFFLNNALTNFASQAERDGRPAVNRMAAGKRPYTSMAPTIVFDADDRPVLAIGAAGGARIPSYIAQAGLGVLAWKQDLATALAQPHWHNANGPSELEQDSPAAGLTEALRSMGHEAKTAVTQSGLAGIARTPSGWVGAADPRRDGAAVGD
ncbi:gamma-glutamyltransferase family protein [Stella sp.]|uniref:gamma-glutamyltransferase family protein n=1 Tax=Stella sp. TaxID=2912054 RepID=UPI0035ADF054